MSEDLGPDDVGSGPRLTPSAGAGAPAGPAPSSDEEFFPEEHGPENLGSEIDRAGFCLMVDEASAQVEAVASGVTGAVGKIGAVLWAVFGEEDGCVDDVPSASAAADAAAAAAAVAAAVAI